MGRKCFLYDAQILGSVLLLASIISLFDIKRVSGHSMLSAFQDSQFLLIFRAMYGVRSSLFKRYVLRWARVEKGDVVVFKIRGRYVIKRCYANDSDSIYFYKKENDTSIKYFMKVDDVEFSLEREAYYRLFIDCDINETEGIQTIPKGCLLLLGDNESESFDCRDYGYITEDSILGKVLKWK